jgi:hypothetical protein
MTQKLTAKETLKVFSKTKKPTKVTCTHNVFANHYLNSIKVFAFTKIN